MRRFLLLLPFLPAAALAAPVEPSQSVIEPIQIVAQETQQQAPVEQPAEVDRRRYPYASLQLGVGFPNDYSGKLSDTDPFSVRSTLELNTGFNAEAAVGYRFNDVRTDLSVGYGSFGVDRQKFRISGADDNSVSGDGSVNVWTVMANLYYDIPINRKGETQSPWSPYIGAGIGYANIGTPSCAVAGCYDGGSSGSFAWQAKLGLSYQATPGGAVFLEGGYLGTIGHTQTDSIRFGEFGTWRLNLGWRQRL